MNTSIFRRALESNKKLAADAAFLSAGDIANNKLAQVATKAAPLMVRGYVDTPVGRLLLANAAMIAAGELRPADRNLNRLTNAMVTRAYADVIATLDIEGYLDQMLNSPEVKEALAKVSGVAEGQVE